MRRHGPESGWPGEDAVAVASPAQGVVFFGSTPTVPMTSEPSELSRHSPTQSDTVRHSHPKDPKSYVKDVKDVKGG